MKKGDVVEEVVLVVVNVVLGGWGGYGCSGNDC